MKTLKPTDLTTWIGRIVDVREPDEFARERLDNVRCDSVPLATLAAAATAWDPAKPVLCLCRSGARSRQAAAQLESLGFKAVATLDGGLGACRSAGLPVLTTSAPLPIQRQVFIVASIVLLAGLALARFTHPAFIVLPWFVSIMLGVAGITGFCPMARILGAMPWNQASVRTSTTCSTAACATAGPAGPGA